jgi:hypothetical protein
MTVRGDVPAAATAARRRGLDRWLLLAAYALAALATLPYTSGAPGAVEGS